MRRLLNEHTGTVHKSRLEAHSDDATSGEALCGALQHVPQRQVTAIPTGETAADVPTTGADAGDRTHTDDVLAEVESDVARCGRCFEDAGGY